MIIQTPFNPIDHLLTPSIRPPGGGTPPQNDQFQFSKRNFESREVREENDKNVQTKGDPLSFQFLVFWGVRRGFQIESNWGVKIDSKLIKIDQNLIEFDWNWSNWMNIWLKLIKNWHKIDQKLTKNWHKIDWFIVM